MNSFKAYRGLPKSIYILFFVQVINRFGDFVLPFLTLFLTKKLGYSFETAGIIAMITSLLAIPGSLTGGKLADQIGRRKTYLIAQTLAGICLIPCAFVQKPQLIVILLFLSTFCNAAVRPAISAIVADILPPAERQLGYSLIYLGINLGVSLGPIVAGFLFNNYLALLFIGDALTSFIAVGLVFMNIKETNPAHQAEVHNISSESEESGNIFTVLWRRPQILAFLVIDIAYTFAYTQHRFSLPLMLEDVFQNKGAEAFGYLMSINAFTVIVMTVFLISITKRFKPLVNIIIAGVLYAIGFGMIGMIHSFQLFAVSTILWTIGEILVVTNHGVYMANNSPKNFRGRFNSIGALSWASGSALGTSLMGRYMGIAGIRAVWPLTAGVAGIAAISMLMLHVYSLNRAERLTRDSATR
ncbi:MAG: dipeptide/tripeptide permease [Anaerosolibacter sp.]|jgi:MFS family permease|uniref:MDR family MFS transporter n=1 Tax=Anaerosolibacter sp. TaxID=1872527 RepID=UPI002630D6A5|nr:MFS transporter [Anaerosolibacter sp.]MDF2548904.1 dipeptide/tripeptide permease [Anaerosolibacter sp.]